MLTAVRESQQLEEVSKQSARLGERRESLRARCARVEDELGNWNLFARCMSNDGLIALAIDDAGPALSALANDLLLACYGPRFTVSIRTLLETAKGEQKEGFDIVVHDGDTGDSKSVGMMSGGERTLVELCLTRAIAVPGPKHGTPIHDPVHRRGGRRAGSAAQAHVHGDEEGSPAPGRL
jgi:exonuclease SbcC